MCGQAHWIKAVSLSAVLAAPTDPVELPGHAGEQQDHLSQNDAHRQGQGHHEAGGQVEVVGLLLEGPLPAEQQGVECGNEQSDIAQSRLRRQGHRNTIPLFLEPVIILSVWTARFTTKDKHFLC